MHKDTIVGIVGAVILVAAMVGVFLYERNSPAAEANGTSGSTSGALVLANLSGAGASGTVAVQKTTTQMVNLGFKNMTKATFTVKWTPGSTSSDTVQVTVTPPVGGGNSTGVTSTNGSATITINVPNPKPSGAAEAAGIGNWTVAVNFMSAQATTQAGSVPPIPGAPGTPLTDSSLSFQVTSSVEAWLSGK
ncbi:MAG: hypothetical protein ACYDDF_09290 [Thermoplasmatota archaeon]